MSVDTAADEVLAFRHEFRGTVVMAESQAAYHEFRTLFNSRHDLRPLVIARCASAGDVQKAIALARDTGLPLAVRGGGRHVAGYGGIDGGLVIDLSDLNEVRVDAHRGTVRFGGGARVGDVLTATTRELLSPVTGVAGHIGAAGLTLGGGIGWLSARHGFASDNIVSVDLVTADGELRHVTADSDPELFWGVRGAGPNFGVVVAMETRLHAIPDRVTAGDLVFGLEREEEVLACVRELNDEQGDDFYFFLTYARADEASAGAAPVEGPLELTVSIAFLDGSETTPALERLRSFDPLRDDVRPTTYLDLHLSQNDVYPAVRQYWGAEHVDDVDGDVIEAIDRSAAEIVGESIVVAYPFRGRMAMREPGDGAFACRDTGWDVASMAFWRDAAEDETQIAWADRLERNLRASGAVSRGVYPNMISTLGVDRLREYYGDDSFRRLAALKAVWDPENRFRRNANIPPVPEGVTDE